MFKNQLGEYAQKAGLRVPTYQVIKEGPPHDPKYKATVFVGDQIYESPTSFGNLKKAEHAAAEVALNALGTKLSLVIFFSFFLLKWSIMFIYLDMCRLLLLTIIYLFIFWEI